MPHERGFISRKERKERKGQCELCVDEVRGGSAAEGARRPQTRRFFDIIQEYGKDCDGDGGCGRPLGGGAHQCGGAAVPSGAGRRHRVGRTRRCVGEARSSARHGEVAGRSLGEEPPHRPPRIRPGDGARLGASSERLHAQGHGSVLVPPRLGPGRRREALHHRRTRPGLASVQVLHGQGQEQRPRALSRPGEAGAVPCEGHLQEGRLDPSCVYLGLRLRGGVLLQGRKAPWPQGERGGA